MSKICFVSYEIHPVTWGGCGVLLYNAAHVLLQQGHQVIFILEIPRYHFNQFDPGIYPNSHNCKAYHVEALCTDIDRQPDDFPSLFLWRSYRFHWATQKVVGLEQPDIVEFFEYNGVAYYALLAKLTQAAYKNTHLGIRLHNSDQLMNVHQPTTPLTKEHYFLYALEHSALRLAETILFPSHAYLAEAYQPYYEPWLGQLVHSKPPLRNHPKMLDGAEQQTKNKVLFYGRLFGFKGADLFVDAAVKLLSEGNYKDLCFVLVGYDPQIAPDGSDSYQAYLLKRIPKHYQAQFEFAGQLNWSQLEALLPQIYCAVFPNYFESFCYAAHELYAAGTPLIVSSIPAFRDYFKDQENALLFDGTVADLARQIKTLWQDKALREKIKRPYHLTDHPLGNFYEGPFRSTWMNLSSSPTLPSILVCILDDGSHLAARTLESLKLTDVPNMQVVILQADQGNTETGALWFLGRLYNIVTGEGQPIDATRLKTAEALLILRAGDLVCKDYIAACLGVLARQSEISFVGCWKRVQRGDQVYLDTFPIDAALELVPFGHASLFSRAVMRTEPDKLLIDLFDPRLIQMGEIGYLWDLEAKGKLGAVIPERLLEQNEDDAPTGNEALLAYLVARDRLKNRKERLVNYLLATQSAQTHEITPVTETRFSEEVATVVRTIGNWRIGRMIGQNPIMVKTGKTTLRWLRQRIKT